MIPSYASVLRQSVALTEGMKAALAQVLGQTVRVLVAKGEYLTGRVTDGQVIGLGFELTLTVKNGSTRKIKVAMSPVGLVECVIPQETPDAR